MSGRLEISMVPNTGGRSEKIAISAANAVSSTLFTSALGGYVNVLVTADCFMRMGAAPVAVVDTDQFVPANNLLRVGPIPDGYKLAFITSAAAGFAYITKES